MLVKTTKKSKQRSDPRVKPWHILVLGGVLLVALILWRVIPSAGPETEAPAGVTLIRAQADWPSPSVWRVRVKDAWQAAQQGDVVFVDTRDAESFARMHIPGAVNIPLAEMATRYQELDPNQWIITYCT